MENFSTVLLVVKFRNCIISVIIIPKDTDLQTAKAKLVKKVTEPQLSPFLDACWPILQDILSKDKTNDA